MRKVTWITLHNLEGKPIALHLPTGLVVDKLQGDTRITRVSMVRVQESVDEVIGLIDEAQNERE